jgi:hypothetical protein
MGRVRPRMQGRGLPVPPLIPSIAVIGLLVGLTIGYSLGEAVKALAAPAPTPLAVATPAAATTRIAEVDPPSGGLSLEKAMTAFQAAGYDPTVGSVSMRVVPGDQVEPGGVAAPAWVWVLTRQETCTPFGKALGAGPDAAFVSTITTWSCLEADVIDYRTGEFLSATVPVTGW